MMIKNYQCQSCLAPYIEALILQKRLEGFQYDTEEYHLKHSVLNKASHNL